MAYPNRSDLRSGDRTYGDGVNKAAVRTATPDARPLAVPPPEVPAPGDLGPLTAPTDRGAEPVTAGLVPGAGLSPLDTLMSRYPQYRDLQRLAEVRRGPV